MKKVWKNFILLLLLLVQPADAQSEKAVLVDSFGTIPCSESRSRHDEFFANIAGDDGAVGYVIVNEGSDLAMTWRRRRLFEDSMIFRRFDSSRIVFLLRSGEHLEHKFEFWKAPKDSDAKLPGENNWSYFLKDGEKAFLLTRSGFDESECAPKAATEFISRFLHANTAATAKIVIHCNGPKCFHRERKIITKEFVEKEKIPADRFHFLYVPIRNEYYYSEYWLVP